MNIPQMELKLGFKTKSSAVMCMCVKPTTLVWDHLAIQMAGVGSVAKCK